MNNHLFSGKYETQGEIARGGMGVVYKAIHKSLNRTVAIKVLHPQYAGDPSFLKRFQREARAMARLDHENIIRVYDVAEDQGAQYIVMEFFPGKDLKQVILERGFFSPDQALAVALQMAEALTYAHAQGIVHRDIKPGNVMIDGRGRVKLADFGIAAATDEISVTATGQIIGTPEYMSPEQARGEAIDGRSDLYSLGIVLYEMLTATTPFERLSRMSIIAKLLYEPKEFDLSFSDAIPPSAQELVRTLLKKQAQHRIADAETLAIHIRSLVKGAAEGVAPDGTMTAMTPLRSHSAPVEDEESTAMLPARSDLRRSGEFSSPKTPPPVDRSGAEKSVSSPPSGSHSFKTHPTAPPLPSEPAPPVKRQPPIAVLAGVAGLILLVAAGMYVRSSPSTESTIEPAPRPRVAEPVTSPVPSPPAAPVASLPEPKKEEEIDPLVGKVNEIEAEVRKTQGDVVQLHSEADGIDARHLASQTYLQAVEWENKGSKAFQEGTSLMGEKQYQEASDRLQEAKGLLVRAHQGFKKAKEEAGAQVSKDPSLPKQVKAAKKSPQAVVKASVETRPAAPVLPPLETEGSKALPLPPEANKESAKLVAPSAVPQPPRPDIEVVSEILSKLKGAYEGRDMAGLWQISNLSEGRSRILEEIFRDFPIVKVSIANFSLTGELASANVVITRLVDRDGKTVLPREEWKQSKVLIRKEGNRWGKVLW